MKVGIISFAHMHAFSYAQFLVKHPGAELAGIWDADETRGNNAAEQFDTVFYSNLNELLQTDIEAVIICSENANHKEHVFKAANYKKQILCEKPIATEVEDAQAMIKKCEEKGVILQIAYSVRFAPAIQKVKSIIQSGKIGEVIAVNATNHGQMPGGWFVEKELSGGGSATDHIVHIMDLLRWMLKDEVKNVYAEFDTRFYDIDVEDSGLVMLELESGIIVSIDSSWSRPKTFPIWGDVTMKISGTEGTLSVDAFKQHSVLYNDEDGKIQHLPWSEDVDEALVNDFIDCVQTKREPSITGIDGLRTLEVVKAAYKANERKETLLLERN